MNCPLCHKILLEIDALPSDGCTVLNPIDYICQTRVKFEGKVSEPHYEHRYGEPIKIVLPPYRIITHNGNTSISVADPGNYDGTHNFKRTVFKHVITIPELHFDTPENILKRINLLITFS